MSSSSTLLIVITIFGLGIAAQVLADRLQIPSILFLITAGLLAGPEVLGIIRPEALGAALPTIIGVSVAIIVFEGAFHLNMEKIRTSPTEALRLGTIGALISLLGTAAAAFYLLNTSWEISFLIGSLLIATGPTVITPIMQVVGVRKRVAAALETEGIVNDVTAAILAIVVFEFVVLESQPPIEVARQFLSRAGTGMLVGMVVAGMAWYLLTRIDLGPRNAPQNSRLIVLGTALVAYGAAEALFSEAGIAAVATAGLLLGNTSLPYRDEIEQFKGDITLLVLSFVFIILTSLLSIKDLLRLGISGILFVIVVSLIIRPIIVALSTAGGRFTRNEKVFISLVGPRGIIPAAVATLFAVRLQDLGHPEAATTLIGAVFLVIFATTVVQGGLARHIAEYLDVIPMQIIVVGAGQAGLALAERLEERGESLTIIERDKEKVKRARDRGYNTVQGDGRDASVLQDAGIENAKIVAAATGDDSVNLVVTQLATSRFDVEEVIARVNDPDNQDSFEEIGVNTISSPIAVAWAMDNTIERPALWNWMTEIGRSGDVQEIEVTADNVIGRTIEELDDELPNGCIIAMVTKDGENLTPTPDCQLEEGDHITFIGRKDAVREAVEQYHPHK
ncbi:MAG: cation:proton antiporter [Candidatus Nanohaloarchaea archaeon]|nr:cation:proton antiporter [Candidatus Nanohaloarchaea archaeon]